MGLISKEKLKERHEKRIRDGISLYNESRYDEALAAFGQEVDTLFTDIAPEDIKTAEIAFLKSASQADHISWRQRASSLTYIYNSDLSENIKLEIRNKLYDVPVKMETSDFGFLIEMFDDLPNSIRIELAEKSFMMEYSDLRDYCKAFYKLVHEKALTIDPENDPNGVRQTFNNVLYALTIKIERAEKNIYTPREELERATKNLVSLDYKEYKELYPEINFSTLTQEQAYTYYRKNDAQRLKSLVESVLKALSEMG